MMNADTFKGWIQEIVNVELNKLPTDKIGRIDPNYSSGLPRIKFDGETTVSGKGYPCLSSYKPVKNDRVLLRAVKGSYVVLGTIDVDPSPLLWSGENYLNAGQTVIPSKKITDCANGWILQWQTHEPGVGRVNTNFEYTHVPKTHVQFNAGRYIRVLLGTVGGSAFTKVVYVHNDRLDGHAVNVEAGANNRSLTAVYEY